MPIDSHPTNSQHSPGDTAQSGVLVCACSQTSDGVWVWAIVILQPVSSWYVVRSSEALTALQSTLGSPPLPNMDASRDIVQIASAVHDWLNAALLRHTIGDRPPRPLEDFLTVDANITPPEYENLAWTNFSQPAPPQPPVADMEMEDTCLCYEEDEPVLEVADTTDTAEEDLPPPAHERYKPTNEEITDEDQMELTGEVEMIDDIGSLAQSLGASHLGLSLPFQQQQEKRPPQQQGLTLGTLQTSSSSSKSGGAIGSMLEQKRQPQQRQEPSFLASGFPPPRLDCFHLLKVIGKGSFGTYR